MDEAERCHALACIAYGKLLITGSAKELIEHSGLTTWSVAGDDLIALTRQLRDLPGVDMVVPLGSTLHLSGTDAVKLQASIASLQTNPALHWTLSSAGLEDVFIKMMDNATDNFA